MTNEKKENASTENDASKQATSAQLIIIVFVMSLATKMFLLPIYLIQDAGRDGYIVLAVEAVFDLASLLLVLFAIKLSPDTDFFTLLESMTGKVGARIITAVIALFLFFKLNIAAAETLTFYTDSVFAEFDPAVMSFLLLIFLGAVGIHTLRGLCRLNELTAVVTLSGIVILIWIVLATGVDFANIFPAMQAPSEVKNAMFHNAAWLGDFTPLVLFIGRTKLKKRTVGLAAVSGIIGSAVTVFFSIVMCAAFGNVRLLADSSTNISSILQFSIGNVYGRIDLLSSVFWSVSAFVETALFFYSACRCVAYTIGRNAHHAIAFGMCAALYITLIFAMTDPTIFSEVVTCSATSVITPVLTMAIPLVAFIAAAVNRKKSSKSGGNLSVKNSAAVECADGGGNRFDEV